MLFIVLFFFFLIISNYKILKPWTLLRTALKNVSRTYDKPPNSLVTSPAAFCFSRKKCSKLSSSSLHPINHLSRSGERFVWLSHEWASPRSTWSRVEIPRRAVTTRISGIRGISLWCRRSTTGATDYWKDVIVSTEICKCNFQKFADFKNGCPFETRLTLSDLIFFLSGAET